MSLLVPARTLRCAGTRCKGEITMKKFLRFLLMAVILFCILTTGVSAFEEEPDGYHIDYYCFGQSNGYDICIIDAIPHFTTCDLAIGDYYFSTPDMYGALFGNQLALYAVKGEEKIDIDVAYERGLIDIGQVAKMIDGFEQEYIRYSAMPIGDLNHNWKLEVADAVIIQKIIAKAARGYDINLCDLNKDGEVNIEDVLLLQKKLAKIVP